MLSSALKFGEGSQHRPVLCSLTFNCKKQVRFGYLNTAEQADELQMCQMSLQRETFDTVEVVMVPVCEWI